MNGLMAPPWADFFGSCSSVFGRWRVRREGGNEIERGFIVFQVKFRDGRAGGYGNGKRSSDTIRL